MELHCAAFEQFAVQDSLTDCEDDHICLNFNGFVFVEFRGEMVVLIKDTEAFSE